ncbi:MAG: aroma-sacti cluster domain-containing protein [Acidobacteriota bacterium]
MSHVDTLHDAGLVNKDELTDAQKEAIEALTEDEVNTVVSVYNKVKGAMDNSTADGSDGDPPIVPL